MGRRAQRTARRPTIAGRSGAGKAVRVTCLDEANQAVPVGEVIFAKTAAYPR
jgi:hypothetical protein